MCEDIQIQSIPDVFGSESISMRRIQQYDEVRFQELRAKLATGKVLNPRDREGIDGDLESVTILFVFSLFCFFFLT